MKLGSNSYSPTTTRGHVEQIEPKVERLLLLAKEEKKKGNPRSVISPAEASSTSTL
ncbi:MAG TPA: hypothetical protein VFR94_13365 [Nitrososphaeraceae archaeon]|nr:hypothetical protein [Nitrososphaeraceae archaeon]